MACAEFAEVALVEQGQARGEQFAVDHAFGQALRDAEADALGQFGERAFEALLVAGFDMAGAVADHHPVHLATAILNRGLRTLEAGFPDQFGVERQATDLEGFSIDLPDEVEIDEAVIERGDERIGPGCGVAGEGIVAARRVEQHEVHALAHLGGEIVERFHAVPLEHGEVHVGQGDAAAAFGFGAVFKVAVQGALARVKIDRSDPRALIGERDGDVHGSGRLASAALFVGEDDTVRGLLL